MTKLHEDQFILHIFSPFLCVQLGLTRLEIRGQMLSKCVQQPSSLVVTSDVINPMLHSAVPPVNFLSQASIFSPYYASLSASINIIRFVSI